MDGRCRDMAGSNPDGRSASLAQTLVTDQRRFQVRGIETRAGAGRKGVVQGRAKLRCLALGVQALKHGLVESESLTSDAINEPMPTF